VTLGSEADRFSMSNLRSYFNTCFEALWS